MTAETTADAGRRDGGAAARAAGPDFLCVGLQKAGTQWLYDQLQRHPDFWMPPVKELHYFDRDFPDRRVLNVARNFVADPERFARTRAKNGHAEIDDRAADFLRRVAHFDRSKVGLGAYAGLFAPKGRLISGDITPAYSVLEPGLIRKLAGRFPAAKVCLMLREPVSRLWSAWRMQCESRAAPWLAERDFDRFRDFSERPLTLARSYPSVIAERWRAAFGERFATFFLDDVAARPDETRAGIVAFLGGDPSKGSGLAVDYNRKARSRELKRSDRVQAIMRERFEQERRICAETFGGPALTWPDAPY